MHKSSKFNDALKDAPKGGIFLSSSQQDPVRPVLVTGHPNHQKTTDLRVLP